MHREYDFLTKTEQNFETRDGFNQDASPELDNDTTAGQIQMVSVDQQILSRNSPRVLKWLVAEVKFLRSLI